MKRSGCRGIGASDLVVRGSLVFWLALGSLLGVLGCRPVARGAGHARWQPDEGQPDRSDPVLHRLIALQDRARTAHRRLERALLRAARLGGHAAGLDREQWADLLDRRLVLLIARRRLADRIALRRMALADGAAAVDAPTDDVAEDGQGPTDLRAERALEASLVDALDRAALALRQFRARQTRTRAMSRSRGLLFKLEVPSRSTSLGHRGGESTTIKQARVAGKAGVPPGLQAAVGRQLGRLHGCVPPHLSRDGVWLNLRATLTSDGSLRGASVRSDEPLSAVARRCIVEVIHAVRGPAIEGGGSRRVSLPLVIGGES